MTQVQKLLTLCVRLVGIAIVLVSVHEFIRSFRIDYTSGGADAVFINIVLTVIPVLAALAMIAFPRGIAMLISPRGFDWNFEVDAPLEGIETLAVTLIGLYFLVQALLDSTYLFAAWVYTRRLGYPWNWTEHYAGIAMSTVVELCAAIGLLLGSRGISRILQWTRSL